MSTTLTSVLSGSNSRINALENQDFDDNSGIAKIEKQINGFKISIVVNAVIHQYHICSNSLICSSSLMI